MKILIATPLYPPDVGGPAKYAQKIEEELKRRGHEIVIDSFSSVLGYPPLVRHAVYFFNLLRHGKGCQFIFTLDTWSVGMPALLAAMVSRAPLVVRVGGDFLWETYIERGGEEAPLSQFYERKRSLTVKEKIIFSGTRFLTHRAHALLFNSAWQRDIWVAAYGIAPQKTTVVENFFGGLESMTPPHTKVFVAAGRELRLKNIPRLKEAFARVQKRHPQIELDTRALPPGQHLARLSQAYAVVVSSLSEMNPNTIWEGVALGKPFVATKETGATERLEGLGLFIDTTKTGEIEAALESLLETKEYQQFVDRIQSFSYRHTWPAIVDEVLEAAK